LAKILKGHGRMGFLPQDGPKLTGHGWQQSEGSVSLPSDR
jgi:hypothetical protein